MSGRVSRQGGHTPALTLTLAGFPKSPLAPTRYSKKLKKCYSIGAG